MRLILDMLPQMSSRAIHYPSAMAPVVPDPSKVRAFASASAFETWMRRHHVREREIWVRIYKKRSGKLTVTNAEALDVALCWGWIDGIRKSFDAESFLQRYSPRRPKSLWSQINRDHVQRLTSLGRMQPPGQHQVALAKNDGRWDAAYAPMRLIDPTVLAEDLQAAIGANPRARDAFRRLTRRDLFALTFRTNNMKTAAGRARTIATLVETLARGGSLTSPPATRKPARATGTIRKSRH
jgi:uncharacterized protein YdeI (YjbR/CyaY-like superfamily)